MSASQLMMELCTGWDDCYFLLTSVITSVSILPVIIGISSLIGLVTLVPWAIFLIKMAARQATILSYLFRKAPKVDPTKHGGSLIAKVLKSHGVETVFTLSGGHISPILVGAEKLGKF